MAEIVRDDLTIIFKIKNRHVHVNFVIWLLLQFGNCIFKNIQHKNVKTKILAISFTSPILTIQQ